MPPLKLQTARTLKWNTLDRFSTQAITAVVGVVLANILTKEEFGLVGILLIFQAFATILVDSGFGAALLREKNPTATDYSTVFWFNSGVAVLLYLILFACAPLIAIIFRCDKEIIPLSKIMFLTFVVNALSIVQVNRLMKAMNVKMIAMSNTLSLIIGGIIGITTAKVYGAWALVWQSLSMATVKTTILWMTGGWRPTLVFSMATIRRIRNVSVSVFSSSLLNTISLNIYNFVIGIYYSAASFGVYTQADKWSKMGSASISQILTGSFVPLLSKVQDSRPDFERYLDKTLRFTSFILLPVMIGITTVATPLFHLLFATKWDEAIPLFQILTIRGIFIVYISLYSNYLLSLGKARAIFRSEFIKDAFIFIAIAATVFFGSMTILVVGQGLATFFTWIILIPVTSRNLSISPAKILLPAIPYAALAIIMGAAALIIPPVAEYFFSSVNILTETGHTVAFLSDLRLKAFIILMLQIITGGAIYIGGAAFLRLPELPEALGYLLGRFRKKS